MAEVFFYGSLRDRALTEVVLGRALPDGAVTPAIAEGHATRRLADEAYPVLVHAPGRRAEGVLVRGLGEDDLARLAFFEEAEYGLQPITVETADGPREAVCFRGTEKARETAADWDFEAWRQHDRAVAIEAARELMDHYGRLPEEEIDRIWPGIMNRARQRALAGAEEPVLGRLRSPVAPEDVELLHRERAYAGYLAVEEHRIRHRRYDGGWSAPLDRSVVLWGDAVTVVPYDPARGTVLLIEQFRAAPAARGDPAPWVIEVVAGRIDSDEPPSEIARREAEEEAGLTLGRIEEIGRYYTSPGLAAEEIIAFAAEADLPAGEGRHGLAGEHEDIRTIVLGLDEALAALAAGEVNSGPALVSLLWLARERERLRADWAGRG
jgi:nudix-type nucleoside diphosphatase (YffH/AdpP family)